MHADRLGQYMWMHHRMSFGLPSLPDLGYWVSELTYESKESTWSTYLEPTTSLDEWRLRL